MVWVREDQVLSTADAGSILDSDIAPNLERLDTPGRPILIGGDFNSATHLDWTAAARFHAGYGPVPFPTSKLMLERVFSDNFRQLVPDEVVRPEDIFVAIYGHLQHCRIDYIYFKGKGIRAVASRIVRTAPDIDFVWASDHSAVLTIFEVIPQE